MLSARFADHLIKWGWGEMQQQHQQHQQQKQPQQPQLILEMSTCQGLVSSCFADVCLLRSLATVSLERLGEEKNTVDKGRRWGTETIDWSFRDLASQQTVAGLFSEHTVQALEMSKNVLRGDIGLVKWDKKKGRREKTINSGDLVMG